jgi:hypothetical protein
MLTVPLRQSLLDNALEDKAFRFAAPESIHPLRSTGFTAPPGSLKPAGRLLVSFPAFPTYSIVLALSA